MNMQVPFETVNQLKNILRQTEQLANGQWASVDALKCIPDELADAGLALGHPENAKDLKTDEDRACVGKHRLIDFLVEDGFLKKHKEDGVTVVCLVENGAAPKTKSAEKQKQSASPPPHGRAKQPAKTGKLNESKKPEEAAQPSQEPIGATGLPFHPAANAFPLMSKKEHEELKQDMAKYGQRDAIVIHDNQVADGRNRDICCKELGIEPKTVEWDGKGSLLDFIVSKNLRRRHLDASQRAMAATRLKPFYKQEAQARMRIGKAADPGANLPNKGRARDQAGNSMNVSGRSVASAEKVQTDGVPELVKAVDEGLASVSAAAEVAELSREEQEQVVAGGAEAIRKKAGELRKGKGGKRQAKAADTNAPAEDLIITAGLKPEVIASKLVKFLGLASAKVVSNALRRAIKQKSAVTKKS